MRGIVPLSSFMFFCALASAQEGSQPASSNVRGAEHPRVGSDLRITFRLKAPTAQKVQVQPGGSDNGLGKGPFEMVKGEDGIWTVTTPPAVPGFHYYWMLVDGVAVNDPGSETFFGWGKATSGIEVPEVGTDFYDIKNVPHGQVRAFWYHSKVTGQPRRAFVYCPPAYDAHPTGRYPTLFLQHGAGEDERGWNTQGRMSFILDNLIAAGRAKPMVVVMDQGYATRPGGPQRAGQPNVFDEVVIGDLIPAIDTEYRTLADRDHRAIAGLSMGAVQALQIGLTRMDLFSYVGAFSGAGRRFDIQTSYGGVFKDSPGFNRRMHLLWIGAGTAEEAIHRSSRGMHEELARAGINSVFIDSKGTAHEWQTWRKALHDFVPRLFKDSPTPD